MADPLKGELSPKQKAFARFYVTCGNQTEAARKAGYGGDPSVAGCIAMKNDKVRTEIARLSGEHSASTGRMLDQAVKAAEKLGSIPQSDKIAAEILAEMSEQIASQLGRSWCVAHLIRAIKVCAGDLPYRKSTVKTRKDGKTFVSTVEAYKHEPGGIIQATRLLLEECARREALERDFKAAPALVTSTGPEQTFGAKLLARHMPDEVDLDEVDQEPDDPEPPT